jgi:hypothetical protein
MAVYSVTHHQRVDNYAVVQLLTPSDIEVGQSVTLAGLGHGLNGTHTVYALPPYLFTGVNEEGDLIQDPAYTIPNQILFYDEAADLERSAAIPNGTLTYTPVCTWISAGDVEDWLGIGTASTLDQQFLTQCAAASSQFCYRRRCIGPVAVWAILSRHLTIWATRLIRALAPWLSNFWVLTAQAVPNARRSLYRPV